MPTREEIIAALQFDLSKLSSQVLNTTAEAAWSFTYQFESSDPADLPTSTTYEDWTAFSAAEKTAVRDVLDHIESILNVTFTEVVGATDPDINLGKVTLDGFSGYGGYSYSYFSDGSLGSYDGYSVFKKEIDLTTRPDLILHELGHALANKHPFSGADTLPAAYDSNKYTVMSYTANPDTSADGDVLQVFDILALQARWGANDDNNDSGTTYTGKRAGVDTVDAIWDTGGTDWFDASASATAVTLNLNEAAFSTFSTYEDVVIAYDTIIENAKGGDGDDTITGNGVRNKLYGYDGNDTISGGSGKDDLIGGAGNDTLDGGDKNDLLKGGKGGDTLNGGNNVDILSGGNGQDTLNGEKGDDELSGNKGKDTFIFAADGDEDVITDFEDDKDRVLFDFEDYTTKSLIRGLATQDGDDVVYDFGSGDILRILDITVAEMYDDIGVL